MKKLWYFLFLSLMMGGMVACGSDSDDDGGSGNGQVKNDKSKPIVTGGLESAELSMDFRDFVVCKLYGYCNVLPEVIALSEVGIEVKVKLTDYKEAWGIQFFPSYYYDTNSFPSNYEETYYIPSDEIDNNGKFIVNTRFGKIERAESLSVAKRFVYEAIPVVYGGSYTIRSYIKTGDVYQYGETQQLNVPNPTSLIDQLTVNTGSITFQDRSYRYNNSYASAKLAITKDKSLLTTNKIVEVEKIPTYKMFGNNMGDPYYKELDNLYLFRDFKFPGSIILENIYSSCSVYLDRFIQSDYTSGDYYYCEYYYNEQTDGTPVIKMGEIRTFNRSNDDSY